MIPTNKILLIKSILAMLFICFNLSLGAQPDAIQPSKPAGKVEVVDIRIPSKEKIEEYKKDNRFQYEQRKGGISWLDKLKFWLSTILDDLFSGAAKSGIPALIVIVAIVFIVIVIVLKIMGVKFKALLGKKKIDTPEIDFYTENVHEMNFDALIVNALKNKDYRLVVRFLYLKNLKLLSDKAYIQWNINKTNYSYQHEIANADLRSKFLETTFIFDYVWYGEFPLDEHKFSEIQNRMNHFNKLVGNER